MPPARSPASDIKSLEARIRKVEQAIRSVEDDKWKRSDPEKSARADDMLGQLERAIAGIEADLGEGPATAGGAEKKIRRARGEPRALASSSSCESGGARSNGFPLVAPTCGRADATVTGSAILA